MHVKKNFYIDNCALNYLISESPMNDYAEFLPNGNATPRAKRARGRRARRCDLSGERRRGRVGGERGATVGADMSERRPKASDISDRQMLQSVKRHTSNIGAKLLEIESDFPEVPPKVIRAKLHNLLRRGFITGCCCGCRGDFELTTNGATKWGQP